MIDQHFLSVSAVPEFPAGRADVFQQLHGGERVMWRGRAGVAEYAFDQRASLPRWTLPESTEVMVTDQRVLYAHTASDSPDDVEVTSGEMRWLWPQHLRVQPGLRENGRSAAVTQIQLVCGGSDGSWPALVFAGGDLKTVADADRLANVIRQSIARFRVDNATKLRLTTAQGRLLSRLLIGPEFSNYQGGPGQTVSVPGALLVTRAAPEAELADVSFNAAVSMNAAASLNAASMNAAPPAELDPSVDMPYAGSAPAPRATAAATRTTAGAGRPAESSDLPARPSVGEGATRVISVRPGLAGDMARALQAAKAEEATQQAEPDLASRAADLAARVASLVSRSTALGEDEVAAALAAPTPPPQPPQPTQTSPAPHPRHRSAPTVHVDLAGPDRFEVSTTNLAERAEILRRTAARFAANSARTKAAARRPDAGTQTRDAGAQTRDNSTR